MQAELKKNQVEAESMKKEFSGIRSQLKQLRQSNKDMECKINELEREDNNNPLQVMKLNSDEEYLAALSSSNMNVSNRIKCKHVSDLDPSDDILFQTNKNKENVDSISASQCNIISRSASSKHISAKEIDIIMQSNQMDHALKLLHQKRLLEIQAIVRTS
jgi:hypothetical protein